MATPAEPQSVPAGAPESPAPAPEPAAPTGGAPDPHGSPGGDLSRALADGTMVSGRAVSSPDGPPEPVDDPPAASDPADPDPARKGDRPEISELPQWVQDLIKETRGEVARTRVEAKRQAAEEAATEAKKQMAEDIGRALGIITDDTPEEEQLTPDQLSELLAGERRSTRAARTELAVFKAATDPESDLRFNAAALLDSRAFIDSVKDIDPSNAEAVSEAIANAVNANPWLRVDLGEPATDDLEPEAAQPVRRQPAPRPSAPPSGGSFAGGPGGQRQDLASMSIDDFRTLRRNTPRS